MILHKIVLILLLHSAWFAMRIPDRIHRCWIGNSFYSCSFVSWPPWWFLFIRRAVNFTIDLGTATWILKKLSHINGWIGWAIRCAGLRTRATLFMEPFPLQMIWFHKRFNRFFAKTNVHHNRLENPKKWNVRKVELIMSHQNQILTSNQSTLLPVICQIIPINFYQTSTN